MLNEPKDITTSNPNPNPSPNPNPNPNPNPTPTPTPNPSPNPNPNPSQDITTSAGDRVPVNLSINYVSFSAHSDYAQTSEFIATLRPYHVIFVHGGEEEMARTTPAP